MLEDFTSASGGKEKVVLVGLINHKQNESVINEYLDELSLLVETAGGVPIKRFVQRLESPDVRTFIGAGKIQEIKQFIDSNEIDTIVFDDELSPSQVRNIEEEIRCKIIDRNHLILDIFAKRARTAHAKIQVELAQYQYLLPRLPHMWSHLEKQIGVIGVRGPGEKELETDRRIINRKITLLKEKLKTIDRQKSTQRQNRGKLVRVALVGYTNVGKSTIMNLLSKSNIFAEDKLFATLDTTVRKVVIGNLPFLISDTVGFIRKLPHTLIEAFKSTLDEVREADILIHVVDISHPNFEEQIQVVNDTLHEIGSANKRKILLFNKIDKYNYERKQADDLTEITKKNYSLADWKNTWMAHISEPCLFISALKKQNIAELRRSLYEEVKKIHIQRYPYNDFLF